MSGKEFDPKQKQSKSSCLVTGLIVLFVVLILVAIAIPNFLRTNCGYGNWGCKQSEAKQNLGAIFTAYTSYHSDNNTYPTAPFIKYQGTTYNCLAIADWEPKGQIRYNYNCMNTEAFSPATNDSPCPPGIFTTATKDSFTVAACGNVDNDTTIDVWTINDQKKLKNIIDDVKE
jgi:competence protein ComGC